MSYVDRQNDERRVGIVNPQGNGLTFCLLVLRILAADSGAGWKNGSGFEPE